MTLRWIPALLPLALLLLAATAAHSQSRHAQSHIDFHDATAGTFGAPIAGHLAAFADLNADRITDVILVTNAGRTVRGYLLRGGNTAERSVLAGDGPLLAEARTLVSVAQGYAVRAVTPADFDGDAVLDLALCVVNTAPGADPSCSMQIAWGAASRNGSFGSPVQVAQLRDQPMLLDWNADVVADLLGENVNGQRMVVLGSADRKLQLVSANLPSSTSNQPPLSRGAASSHAFAVIERGATQAELLLTLQRTPGDREWAELWQRVARGSTEFGARLSLVLPIELAAAQLLGQAAVADMDSHDRLDLVLAACRDATCAASELWLWGGSTWVQAQITWPADLVGFQPPSSNPLAALLGGELALQLRPGDANADGLLDLLTVARDAQGGRHAALLLNRGGNVFEARRIGPSTLGANVSQVAWFDLHEDGLLDVLVTRCKGAHADVLALLRASSQEEGYFLKVMVLEGRCPAAGCPALPYGLPSPGPFIRYETESADSSDSSVKQTARASQSAQNVHSALSLPFVHFGLGQYANYVEKLTVSVPWSLHKPAAVPRRHVFSFIVPNAQLVVIPRPIDSPASWSNKLFVRPIYDRQVLFVGIALLGTCAFVAMVLGLLQWREVRQDRQEKLQEAQKFHFDAM